MRCIDRSCAQVGTYVCTYELFDGCEMVAFSELRSYQL